MSFSSIVISSGHGKYIRGASDILDEVDEARRVVDRTAAILSQQGVAVKVFHDNTSHDQNTNLNTIVNYHNSQNRQLDVSVHFNANGHTSSPIGTECWYVTQGDLAAEVATSVAKASGLKDRGPKYTSNLFFLNNTAEPAILIEVCFVTSMADADLYDRGFEKICQGIATTLSGKSEVAPPRPEPAPSKSRPLIGKGDYGHNVVEVQVALGLTADGDFGNATVDAVESYQARKGLSVDGMVGDRTWAALTADFGLPAYPPALPRLLTESELKKINDAASRSAIAEYQWRDRGVAPPGYTVGMATAWAQAVLRWNAVDPIAEELGKAHTGNDSIDALAWYNSNFVSLGMRNDDTSLDTLRHLYVLLMGLGMRESSGRYCEGRDQSASNTSSDTAEAGLFQTSFNASTCCTDFLNLFDQYEMESKQGYQGIFKEGVSCSASEWQSYGSGDGFRFQELCRYSPTFAVESCGITLRNLRKHYGPVNEKAAELRREADELFQEVQTLVMGAVA